MNVCSHTHTPYRYVSVREFRLNEKKCQFSIQALLKTFNSTVLLFEMIRVNRKKTVSCPSRTAQDSAVIICNH